MANDTGALRDLYRLGRSLYYELTGKETIARVLDTIDALPLKTKQGLQPVICHKHRTEYGWHVVLELPPGIASKEITSRLDHFAEQTGGHIETTLIKRKLHMDIATRDLGGRAKPDWEVGDRMLSLPLGATYRGYIHIDLPRLPHLFVAGTTGGGKTTALLVWAVALIRQGAQVCVIDLKGLDFWHMREHALVVAGQDGAMKVLAALNKEYDRRVVILQEAGCVNVTEFGDFEKLPWTVLIIDELAELTNKASQEMFDRLARLSRATGICIIAATQRPSHTLFNKFTDTRMLFSGRLCFYMLTPSDSRLILDDDSAAHLPPDIPGRAIWRWDKQQIVQCAYMSVRESRAVLARLPKREGGLQVAEPRTKRLRAR